MEGEQPYLGDLLTMVINHLLNGMIIQVVSLVHLPCLLWLPTLEKDWRLKPLNGANAIRDRRRRRTRRLWKQKYKLKTCIFCDDIHMFTLSSKKCAAFLCVTIAFCFWFFCGFFCEKIWGNEPLAAKCPSFKSKKSPIYQQKCSKNDLQIPAVSIFESWSP